MLAVLAPGQGSQRPGQLLPWLGLPGVLDHLAELSAAAGLDLLHVGTDASAEELQPTEISQPLVVATALVAARAAGVTETAAVLAGHSVGEWAAAGLAGVLDEADVLRLVAVRARAMAAACRARPTGMAAVLGGERQEVVSRIAALGLEVANHNGPAQVVAGGDDEALAALVAEPPAGARVRRLPVAGAFHTAAMATAVQPLRDAVRHVHARDPQRPLVSCLDGEIVTSGDDALARLVVAVESPVRFDLVLQRLARLGVSTVAELPPAGALTGLARRGLAGVQAGPVDPPVQPLQAGAGNAAGTG